eukprot:1035367-Amphidinium_carterae.1
MVPKTKNTRLSICGSFVAGLAAGTRTLHLLDTDGSGGVDADEVAAFAAAQGLDSETAKACETWGGLKFCFCTITQ